jgi:phage terminase large subunit-like protein
LTAASFRRFAKQVGYPLERWQARIIAACFADEPEALILLPRGNGKSTLLAALAVHHLLTVERPAIYCAASSRDQARVIYEAAREFAERAGGVTLRHLELRVPGGHLRVLPSEALKVHGLTPSLSILDEYHAHATDDLYLALRTALLKREGSRLVTISTAPESAATPLGILRARALGQPRVIRRGALIEADGGGIAFREWSVPDGEDATPARVKKANPASWITLDALRSQRDALPPHAWERYHANRIVGRVNAWLPPGAWQACAGQPSFEPGETITVGCDLGGGERSTSAVAWISEPREDGRRHVGVEIFDGEASGTEAGEFVIELCDRFAVREVAADPWQSNLLLDALEQRGITAVAVPQSDARMIPASERLHRAVIEERLLHDGDATLAAHVAAAVAKSTRRGWRLHRTGSEPIDATIALAIALDRAESYVEQPAAQLLGWL